MAEEWHKVWPRQAYICAACQWDIFGSCYCGTCEADRREAAFADGWLWALAIVGMAEAIRDREPEMPKCFSCLCGPDDCEALMPLDGGVYVCDDCDE